jgi:hypothetical protein
MGPAVVQVWAQLSQVNGVVTMVTKLNHSWFHIVWCKFCIHFTSLNIRHFGMVESTGLEIMMLMSFRWHDLPTEFHNNQLVQMLLIVDLESQIAWLLRESHFRFLRKIDRSKTQYLLRITPHSLGTGRITWHNLSTEKWT